MNKTDQAKLVADWAKAQKVTEEAAAVLETAREQSQKYAKAMYGEFGTKPIAVKALGRRYRCLKRDLKDKVTGAKTGESYIVMPVPEFETEHSF